MGGIERRFITSKSVNAQMDYTDKDINQFLKIEVNPMVAYAVQQLLEEFPVLKDSEIVLDIIFKIR
jgi:hypothetical protein